MRYVGAILIGLFTFVLVAFSSTPQVFAIATLMSLGTIFALSVGRPIK